ncbi:hypothetical protein ACHAWX_000494 [Stephanocyclus meneghinianus]
MKITKSELSLWILAIAIVSLSIQNIVNFVQPDRLVVSRPPSKTSFKNIADLKRLCNNGRLIDHQQNTTSKHPEPGSIAKAILPPHLYPNIHQACYFLPTTMEHMQQHTRLLQYYPNSFLVASSQDEEEQVRIDPTTRTIYIRGRDEYYLLWIKTISLWNYISSQTNLKNNSVFFKGCRWFFKVDTDSFLNLHVIEQFLAQYSTEEEHYVGWFGGVGGRKHNDRTVNVAIGSFYGFTRQVMVKWQQWQHDKKFEWGSTHTGEDSQVAFFLREHGICLGVPVKDVYNFRLMGGVWGGFERAHPLASDIFVAECHTKIQSMVDNECFAYAHTVSIEWMPILTGVMAIHVANRTKCPLFGKGVSRIVNGTVYHRVEKRTLCAINDCDPCLKDELTNDCCGWKEKG